MSRIHILSCTDRPGSNALKIANSVKEVYENEGVQAAVFSLADFPLKDVA